jgi:hypothetical protein
MPTRSIPPFRLVAEPVWDEARAAAGFKWAGPDIGTRHRLGGEPTWLQGEATPRCADCGEPMTFYGQLDSIGDDVVLADCGLIYVFVCFDDFRASAVLQSA